MTNHQLFDKSNMAGATSGAGTAHLSRFTTGYFVGFALLNLRVSMWCFVRHCFFLFMLGIVVLDLLQFTASDYPCILPLSLINANQRLIRTCAVHLVINCVFII